MDNYDLSSLPLSGHCADAGQHHSWLTDEENRCAAFSGRSATVRTSEQVQRQQPPSTGDEQISEQRALADFGMSLAPNILEPLIGDDPEDPFATLAAYQSLTFEDDPRHPFDSELGFSRAFLVKVSLMLYWLNQKGMIFLSYRCSQSSWSRQCNPSNLRMNSMRKALALLKVQNQILFQASVQTSIHANGVRLNQDPLSRNLLICTFTNPPLNLTG